MAGGVRSWRCHGVVEEQEEKEEEEEEKVGGWRGRGENFEGGRKNNTRSIKATQNGRTDKVCRKSAAIPATRACEWQREKGGRGKGERERIISVLYSCKSSRRKQEGLDSVYHAKNIVTLTAIYNGFRYRELLIVP